MSWRITSWYSVDAVGDEGLYKDGMDGVASEFDVVGE